MREPHIPPSGKTIVPSEWIGQVRRCTCHPCRALVAAWDASTAAPLERPTVALTELEVDTIRLVSEGMSNKEIADALGISQYTVKNRLTQVYKKLWVRDRSQGAVLAWRLGLII